MDRLARTRSQHFMHSPRRVASPLKLKHGSTTTRHPIKRRRLGSAAQAIPPKTNLLDPNSNSDTEDTSPEGSRRHINPLSSEGGQQIVNRTANVNGHGGRQYVNGVGKKNAKGRVRPVVIPPSALIYTSEDGSSPRKRKRHDEGSASASASASAEPSASASASRSVTSESTSTSHWIEVDEDEAEPEFIAESDQHLIDEAPAYALHRLRKAELTRLWKVAGMWEGEDDEAGSLHEEEDDQGLSKKELVDGLLAARKPASTSISVSPTRSSPRRRTTLQIDTHDRRSTSAASLLPITPVSSSSSDQKDTEATPRAVPRTRSKARVKIDGTAQRTRRPVKGVRERLLKARSKSLGGQGDKEDRKARFGDDVKSPAHGLLNRKARRASSISSTYTTTDTSPPATPENSRQTSRRRNSNAGASRRISKSASHKSLSIPDQDGVEQAPDSDPESDLEPTPLVKRLRPRTKSTTSAADADAEDETTENEDEGLFSPGPSSRLRSKGKSRGGDDVVMKVDGGGGLRRTRSAKLKAKKRLAEDAEDTEVDGEMDIDDEPAQDDALTDQPQAISMIKTKSQTSQPSTKRHTRRNSRLITTDPEPVPISTTSSDLTPPPSSGAMDIEEEETETEATRTTRSGKAFGVWQSRRKRLRQEAMDDPDMDVGSEEEEEAESDEEEQNSFEADLDLSDATISSLTRLLRDELVEMCEARGIEVGGTKPVLAKALLEWRDEQKMDSESTPSSQATARPSSSSTTGSENNGKGAKVKTAKPGKIIHAIGSNKHVSGKTTPVLLRDHVHANDPDTPPLSPPPSEESKRTNGDTELNFDLQELGLEDTVIRPDLLQKLERIGSGGFKDVYVGKYRGRKVAISEFREHLSEMDIRELKLLSEFSHPNIVRFRGICIPEDNSQIQCMLVSELCENGDLFDYIRNVGCPTLKRLLGLMLDIAKGLEYLHTHTPPIIHRDCKSSNILINRAGHAKVGDFGLARVKNSTRSMIRSLVGTVNWQAPELWSPKPSYDYKVDVFSAGMVFWEMMAGWTGEKKYPWEGHNEHYIYDAVGTKHRRPTTSGLRKHWGTEPVALMERMWHQDPRERPTMTDVVDDLEQMYSAA